MINITIDNIIEYIIIMLSDYSNIGYELTNAEMAILLDIVRDKRLLNYNDLISNENLDDFYYLYQIQVNRKNLSRPINEEMSDICELLNHKVKYQPERLFGLIKKNYKPIKWK
jgi:hypothetical protein